MADSLTLRFRHPTPDEWWTDEAIVALVGTTVPFSMFGEAAGDFLVTDITRYDDEMGMGLWICGTRDLDD